MQIEARFRQAPTGVADGVPQSLGSMLSDGLIQPMIRPAGADDRGFVVASSAV